MDRRRDNESDLDGPRGADVGLCDCMPLACRFLMFTSAAIFSAAADADRYCLACEGSSRGNGEDANIAAVGHIDTGLIMPRTLHDAFTASRSRARPPCCGVQLRLAQHSGVRLRRQPAAQLCCELLSAWCFRCGERVRSQLSVEAVQHSTVVAPRLSTHYATPYCSPHSHSHERTQYTVHHHQRYQPSFTYERALLVPHSTLYSQEIY